MKKISLIFLTLFIVMPLVAGPVSVAGLFPIANSGRIVYNFNEGWCFRLGDVAGAEAVGYDDSQWEMVCALILSAWSQRMPVVAVTIKVFAGIVSSL